MQFIEKDKWVERINAPDPYNGRQGKVLKVEGTRARVEWSHKSGTALGFTIKTRVHIDQLKVIPGVK